MKSKWLISGGFIAVVVALVAVNLMKAGAAGTPATGAPKNGTPVKVVKLAPRTLTQTVVAPGTLEASAPTEVRSPFTSLSVKLLVGPGDQVTAGQVIAELQSDELKLQVIGQEAAVARAEASLKSYRLQQQTGPATLAVKVESARGQLLAAQSTLTGTLKQAGPAKQRLDQAQSALIAVQNRAADGNSEAQAARLKLQTAEADYRANPLNAQTRAAYESARTAYDDALRRGAETARQMSIDLAQAYESLKQAEQDLADSSDDSANVRQAKAQVESARLSLETAQAEAGAGGSGSEQMRSAQADLASQQAHLDSLRKQLDQAQLKAPVTGTVLSLGLKSGQPVQQGQFLLELGALNVLALKVRVDEVDVGKVNVGQSVHVKNNAYPTERFSGAVTRVAAQAGSTDARQAAAPAGPTGGTFYEVTGDVQNRDGKLRAGMSAEARVVTDARAGAIVVGLEAVREEGEQASVLLVKDYKVVVRPVKLGLRTQTQVEVLDGLKEGEEVIVAPFTLIKSLKEGTPVKAEIIPAQERGDEE